MTTVYLAIISEECLCPECREEMGLDFEPILDEGKKILEFPTEILRDDFCDNYELEHPDEFVNRVLTPMKKVYILTISEICQCERCRVINGLSEEIQEDEPNCDNIVFENEKSRDYMMRKILKNSFLYAYKRDIYLPIDETSQLV